MVQGLEQLNRADVVGGDHSGRPGGTLYQLRDDSCPKQLAVWPGMILICDARQLRPWLGRLPTLSMVARAAINRYQPSDVWSSRC